MGNAIIDASDGGIVLFAPRNTIISNHIISAGPGNYGAFAGIAVHS